MEICNTNFTKVAHALQNVILFVEFKEGDLHNLSEYLRLLLLYESSSFIVGIKALKESLVRLRGSD